MVLWVFMLIQKKNSLLTGDDRFILPAIHKFVECVDFLLVFKSLNIRNSGEKYKECELPEKFPAPSVSNGGEENRNVGTNGGQENSDEFLPFWEPTMEPSGKSGDLTFKGTVFTVKFVFF